MKLTEQEIIEARKTALTNNPRSFQPWAESINFAREIERLVQMKYWRDFSKEKPHAEAYYAVIIRPQTEGVPVFLETLFWSNARADFTDYPGDTDNYGKNVLFFKPISDLAEELGIPLLS